MKIAFSAKGKDWEAPLDQRFGRAQGFVIYDDKTQELTWHDNHQNVMASQGAGIQAAQNVAELDAQVIITGHTGPKAFNTLKKANIRILLAKEEANLKQAYENFVKGELQEQTEE